MPDHAQPSASNTAQSPASRRDPLQITLLGTGSSGGVPRVGNQWGACDPQNPKNRRRRCALLAEQHRSNNESTRILIDAGADLREQLISAAVTSLDGVLLTHSHADHIFGLDDLRQLAMFMGRSIDVYMDAETSAIVMGGFNYCFRQAPSSSYPAFCSEQRISHPNQIDITGDGGVLSVNSIKVEHGDIHALGFRLRGLVYLPDMKKIADEVSWSQLDNVDVLVIDALRHKSHPTHLNVEEALALIDQVKPTRAILTNMHSDLDYETLMHSLPDGVVPGYDGLQVMLD